MFKELGPLLRQRTVVLILNSGSDAHLRCGGGRGDSCRSPRRTRLEDDTIRVNLIPRKLNESENDAVRTYAASSRS